jgi:hypothetical protein
MAAQNPNTTANSGKFWRDGLCQSVLCKSTPDDNGTQKYWLEGRAQGGLVPTSGGGSTSYPTFVIWIQ